MTLAGRIVLITGAASGIGAELARRLAARGAHLALLDVRAEPLERVAAALPGARWAQADVRDRDGLAAAIDDLAERAGGLGGVSGRRPRARRRGRRRRLPPVPRHADGGGRRADPRLPDAQGDAAA